jgi:hypothetical protein
MSSLARRLDERLHAHPQLRARVEAILAIAEAEAGTLETADEAEQRVIDEVRRLGQEVLQDWAMGKVRQGAEALRQGMERALGHGQKNCTGIPRLGRLKSANRCS